MRCLSILVAACLVSAGSLVAQEVPLDTLPAWRSNTLLSSWSIAWGDVDGDGDLDLACGKGGGGYEVGMPNEIYFNNNGVLEIAPGWSSRESDITTSVAWGDVDGDGDLDLACGNRQSKYDTVYGCPNRIYMNVDGVLEEYASWSSVEWDATQSVAWGDFDNDGDLDLACGNYGDEFPAEVGQPNRIYFNHNGVLNTVAGWSTQEEDVTLSVAWADIDGDGYLELACGNWPGNPNRIYHNTGGILENQASWNSLEPTVNYYSWAYIAWCDADGDGDLDLAYAIAVARGEPQGPIRIYMNYEGAIEGMASWTSTETFPATSLAWGDMDGDADADLAVTSHYEGGDPEIVAIRVYQGRDSTLDNMASWSCQVEESYFGYKAYASAWGDVDSDGDLDLALGAKENQTVILMNHGGVLEDSTHWKPELEQQTVDVDLGDIDNDGDLDLACGNWFYFNRVYENVGGELQTSWEWASSDYGAVYSIAFGDANGDGYLDLACGRGNVSNRRTDALYINHEGVLESQASWTSHERDITHGLAWGDVDSDGDLDLACGCSDLLPIRLYLNHDGQLDTVSSWSNLDNEGVWTLGLAWGDVDNDGDLDLACGNGHMADYSGPGYNVIYYNNNGVLDVVAGWASEENDITYSVAWGDVDGDGDLDLACGNVYAPNRVYINQSGKLDRKATWTSLHADYTLEICWIDVDLDGDLDLASANGWKGDQPNRVYINRSGTLEQVATWNSPPEDTWGMAAGDIDGDGDPDIVYGNASGFNTLYLSKAVTPRNGTNLPNTPPWLEEIRIVEKDSLNNQVRLGFKTVDFQSDACDIVAVEYSTLGGGNWRPAAIIGNTGRLASSPAGEYHELIWDAEADGADGYDVRLRVKVASNPDLVGLIQRPAVSYFLHVGRIDGRPKIALLYPRQSTPVIDSLRVLGCVWDATNFSDYRILLGQLPDTTVWEEVSSSTDPVPYPGHIASLDLTQRPAGGYIVRTIATDGNGAQAVTDKYITLADMQAEAPSVVHCYPPQGARNIPGNAPVVVLFDRDINQPAVDNETFSLLSESGERYTDALYEFSSRSLMIKPEQKFSEDQFHYAVVSSRLPSRQGVAIGGEFVMSFNTSAAFPTGDIDSLYPYRGQVKTPVDIEAINVYYNRISRFRYVTVFSLADDTVLNDVVPQGQQIGSVAIQGLLPKTYYIVRISDRPDFHGQSDYMSYFITEDTQMPLVMDYSPESDAWLVGVNEEIKVRFNKPLNTFSIDSSSFYVTGPGGRIGGYFDFSI
ncbi:MAG: VCBS repeat-containing protein, partial [Planctomycetota bacterium]